MYNSIGFYDWQTVLTLIEALGWAGVVGVGFMILTQYKTKILTKQNKQIVWVIFAAWAVASVGLAIVDTYTYFHDGRDSILQGIEQQKKQYGE